MKSLVFGNFPSSPQPGAEFTYNPVFMEMLGRFLVLFKKPEKALSAE